MCVHGADINPAPALHTEEEPQDSNDPHGVLRRRDRSCQRCGHRAAQERVRGSRWHSPASPSQAAPLPARRLCGARWSGFDAGSALSLASSRSTPRGSGSTDRGLCVLHEGPTYPKYPQPSSSSTPPSCSTSRRHRAATRLIGPAPSDRSKQQLSHPAGPSHQRLEMPRHPKLPEVMRQHMSAGAVLEPHGASSRGDVADGMVNDAHRRMRIGAAVATTVTKGRWWERGSLSHRAGDLQRVERAEHGMAGQRPRWWLGGPVR